jgi:hypothetical protein
MSYRNHPRLERDLQNLSRGCALWIGDDYGFVVVDELRLPPGYNCSTTRLLITLPPDYPLSPPGVGDNRVYLPPTLRFKRRELRDLHPIVEPPFRTPGFGPWAWLCYERVDWIPEHDNLIRFVEMVRADLTKPGTV